jgi:hypothetical protein
MDYARRLDACNACAHFDSQLVAASQDAPKGSVDAMGKTHFQTGIYAMNFRRVTTVLTLCVAAIAGAAAFGAAPDATAPMAPAMAAAPAAIADMGAKLRDDDRQLTAIEGLYARIQAGRTTEDRDKSADELEARLAAYATAMLSSHNAALGQAQLAIQTNGRQGSVDSLRAFEDLASNHESRLRQIDNRAQKLSPKAGSLVDPAKVRPVQFGLLILKAVGGFLVTPAQGAIALSVWSPCHTHPAQQPACNKAIVAAVGATASAQSTFSACWASKESVRPKWWRAFLRGGCATALAIRLA